MPGDECPIDDGSAIGGVAFYEGERLPGRIRRRPLLRRLGPRLHLGDVPRRGRQTRSSEDDEVPARGQDLPRRQDRRRARTKTSTTPDLLSDEGLGDGEIHRIVYSLGAPTARLEAKPQPYGPVPLDLTFDASESSDPSGEPLSTNGIWTGTGRSRRRATKQEGKTFTQAELDDAKVKGESGNRVVAVRVEDGMGLTSVARVTVYPGDKPPVPTITAPAASFKWSVGSEIKLDASAVDAQRRPDHDAASLLLDHPPGALPESRQPDRLPCPSIADLLRDQAT